MASVKGIADIRLINSETGEEIVVDSTVYGVGIDLDEPHEDYGIFDTYPTEASLTIHNPKFNGISFAYIGGVNNNPKIKRLIYLYNRTKKKRIKNKLNNRIISESLDLILDEI